MKNNSVLILEDCDDMRDLLVAALQDNNLQVHAVGSAKEAFDHLEKHSPDSILMDMNLPDMKGAEFIQKLRHQQKWQDIKVILISGEDGLPRTAANLNVSGFIQKPFELNHFYEEIERQILN